ncbi:CLUMA_CG002512, isoform A [Clunio marinus]|uniref:CLUMA_CG002512, isoform A n=1 Tax=Clunio marinus TaxID=568069 RepID=A0A1J1HLQ8_9DIPT|nr:CLUMA_CG002512, isoform A [Clunio marinus]
MMISRGILGLNFFFQSKSLTLIRKLSVQAAASYKPTDDEYARAKPYEQIPSLTKIELAKRFLPGGKFHEKSIVDVQVMLRDELGELYRIPGMFGQREILTTFDPNDVEIIHRTEGAQPYRRGLETITYYRKKLRSDVYSVGGLILEQGDEWSKMRTAVNPILMQPRTAKLYIPTIDGIVQDFMANFPKLQDENGEMPDNFQDLLNRWTLESIVAIALEKRLGLMDLENRNEKAEKIAKTVRTIFELTAEFEFKPSVWRIYHTKAFKKLLQAFDDLTDLSLELIEAAKKNYQEETVNNDNNEESILFKLLKKDPRFASVMAFDMIFGGIDTTSSTLSGVMYCLAKNPDKQEILRQELIKVLTDKNTPLTPENMNHLPYLRACIKEGIRVLPPVMGNMRRTGENIVLRGYQVPKNVDVMLALMHMYKDEKNFGSPKDFIPERWLKHQDENACPRSLKQSHPFVYLPFGFGPRVCAGKRIAEMEIEVFLSRVIRNYRVEWHHEDMKVRSTLVNLPGNPLNFRLIQV